MSNRKIGFGLGASLLALTAAAPALGAVIDYPNGSTNSSPIILTDNSTQLQVTTGAATQSGVISESGPTSSQLEKIGAGTLIFTADNTYTGPTIVSAGTLQLGNGGTTGSIQDNNGIINNGTIVVDHSGTFNFYQTIDGTGAVNFSGPGTTAFIGNIRSGQTVTVSAGTLQIGNGGLGGAIDGNILNNSIIDVVQTTTFQGSISGTGQLQVHGGITTIQSTDTHTGGTIVSGGTLRILDSLAGNVTDNSAVQFGNSGTLTFAGAISGNGTVEQAGGTLILTGANTYTGNTIISSGVLQIGNGGTQGSVAGNIVTGGLGVKFARTDTVIYSGAISGGGQLTQAGSGTLILAGANTYSGDTHIDAGTLQIGNGGTTGSLGVGAVIDNGTLAFNRSDAVTVTQAITGSGGLTQIGPGTLTLTGVNTFTGQVGIGTGSSLALSGLGSIQAADELSDDGVFDISAVSGGAAIHFLTGTGLINLGNQTLTLANPAGAGHNSTFSGVISGTGSIIIAGGAGGSGAVRTFAGTNTYSGATTIQNGGTLILAGSIANSTVQNAGNLVLASNSGIGSLSGTGVVDLVGNGLTLVQARDTFAGVIQDTHAFGGSAGSLFVFGKEILTGANTYTGSTRIGPGATLQVGNGGTTGSIVGDVVNNGTLVFDRSDAITFSGAIFGNGSVKQIGAGITTLSANNFDIGLVTVSAGTLNVTGSLGRVAVPTGGALPLPGTVNVANGGRLTGTGRVFVATVASGGTLSPGVGDAPGTFTVQDNLTLASGAKYVVAISPTVTGLTNVGGMASVDGALTVNAATGSYAAGRRYTLLSATGGLSGTFASVSTTGLNAYKTSIGYDASSVFLTLSANALSPLLPAGIGANGVNAAKAIDAAIAGGATVNSGFNALFGLSGAGLGNAVTQLSGETGAGAAQGGSQAFLPFMSVLTSEGASGSPTVTAANFAPGGAYGADGAPKPAQLAAGGTRVWGTVYGRHTGIAADSVAGTQSLKAGNAGFAAGIEMQVSDTLRLGAAAGGGHGSFNAGNGRGASDDAMLGAYGNLDVMDQGYVAGAFSYGWHDVDTLRLLTISGTDMLSAKYAAHDVGMRIEGGWRVALDDQDSLVPYAALTRDSFQAPAYSERAVSGSSNFALSYAAHDTDFGQSELGLKAGRIIDGAALELSAAWAHQLYGAPFAVATFQALPGSSFTVQSGRIATDTALLGAGVDWHGDDGLSFGARIDSQIGGGTTALAGTGTINLRW